MNIFVSFLTDKGQHASLKSFLNETLMRMLIRNLKKYDVAFDNVSCCTLSKVHKITIRVVFISSFGFNWTDLLVTVNVSTAIHLTL